MNWEWLSFNNVTRVVELALLTGGLVSLKYLGSQVKLQSDSVKLQVDALGKQGESLKQQAVALEQQAKALEQQREQSADELQWRKLVSYHEYFTRFPDSASMAEWMTVLRENDALKHLSGGGTPLPEALVQKIHTTPDLLQKVRRYLDEYEQFCGAIHVGVIDREYAQSLEAGRVCRIYTVVSGLIELLQRDNEKAYIELENLARDWIRDREERQRQAKAGAGVKPKAPGKSDRP